MKGTLVLEDGYFWEGESSGASAEGIGQVVFYTGIVGYQEILTDPAYAGKIVVMTYPHIGNYGVSEEGLSSEKVWVKGLIVKEISRTYSNWQAKEGLKKFATENKIPVLAGVDTQDLTKHLRTYGTKKGILSTCRGRIHPTRGLDKSSPYKGNSYVINLIEKIKSSPDLLDKNLARRVSCPRIYQWKVGVGFIRPSGLDESSPYNFEIPYKIVAIDLGMRRESLQQLSSCGCKITVAPADTKVDKILSLKPDGIFLSSGPGDPAVLKEIVKEIKRLLGKLPLLGIGLGYQILGLAAGAKTFRMKFGHHGLNQPVRNLLTSRCSITAQHHLFALDPTSLNKETEVTHINLNDQTLEGIRDEKFPVLGIQYYPESNDPVFNEFKQLMQSA